MTVERVNIVGVRMASGRVFVPLFDPSDGTWWTLDQDGASTWDDADAVDSFADELAGDFTTAARAGHALPIDDVDIVEAYRELADVMRQTQRLAADPITYTLGDDVFLAIALMHSAPPWMGLQWTIETHIGQAPVLKVTTNGGHRHTITVRADARPA